MQGKYKYSITSLMSPQQFFVSRPVGYNALGSMQACSNYIFFVLHSRSILQSSNHKVTLITLVCIRYIPFRVIFIVVFLPAFHPKTGLDALKVQPISKAQARQRLGRAGRESSGVCYRLFTEEQFDELKEMTTPEIQRCNLASVVLQLMALGICDVLHFDFLDRPPQDAIENALEQLVVLGAVRKGNSGYEV